MIMKEANTLMQSVADDSWGW